MRWNSLGTLAAAGMLAAGLASAATADAPIAAQVAHEIRMYPYYSIWDNVNIRVNDGQVELLGEVNEPFKKADLQRIARQVPGVTGVSNELQVLPLSNFDNQIRVQVARAIFRDPSLSRYAMQPVPSIHIIVDNGHVTLEGVVANQMDKNLAGLRASGASLSFGPVVNNLRVEGKVNG